ncbi:MAG TPA: ATP-dependent DNA helicase [Candidatus Paceibacterota bacterium]|nr:ATP-dependent DNA helicase [Candidatus Paceibacterota bacterium]
MDSRAFDTAYRALNAEQKKAVDTIDGPVMVIAGPGTGKTQVLSLRVGRILQMTDVSPGNILCLTFTEAAAVNMTERLVELIGSTGYKVAVHTFHGFARDVIASYPEYFYNGAEFAAADDLAQLDIFERVFRDLPRGDPLASMHEGAYTYLKDARRAIGLLKQAGLSPDDVDALIAGNTAELDRIDAAIADVFSDRLSKKSIPAAANAVEMLTRLGDAAKLSDASFGPGSASLAHAVAISLGRALKRAHESDSATPLSEWKAEWTRKTDAGERVFKDRLGLEKMRSLARVYRAYRSTMRAEAYYDFDDMLLDVIEALRTRPSLLAELEERYQYMLVDEFQDTNDAQLSLVRLLGSAAVNEGRPNIMIVGDDDQAIYRFQGAEISNILDFPKFYADHTLVVLTKNYRSTQDILDVAREVIVKSSERLETVLPALEKKLIASRPDLGAGHIRHAMLPTRTHEHAYIAREIGRMIEAGADPSGIAVITRRHRELGDIARVLVAANIPITYERKQNVFEEPHIRWLVLLARFLVSVVRHGDREADHFLPEILSAPFWGLAREDIWRISVAAAARTDRTWIGAMQDDAAPAVRNIAKWFADLGVRAKTEPLERILDAMIGTDGALLPALAADDPHEDSAQPLAKTPRAHAFTSGFREYYFGAEARKKAEARYLMFLSSLRVFVGALRDHRHGAQLFLEDLVAFADLHERNGMTLADTTPFSSAGRSIHLLTAHKSKGLEFDTVFVASCQEEVWAGRGFPNKLPFPMNLPIERDEGGDDQLRIFYVALTRAKRDLLITAYRQDDSGKPSLKVNFIAPENEDGAIAVHLAERPAELTDADLLGSVDVLPVHPEFFPIVPGERAILMELVKNYRMSVTHLNNFLNVAVGGPAVFLEQNLLRFPQAMSPSSGYGDAMHKAIERHYREFRRTERVPSADALLGWFRETMNQERMTESERTHFLRAGEAALPVWWEHSGHSIDATHRSEVDFKSQGVVVGGVPLIGKIDKMLIANGEVAVYDFKTGKAKGDWEGKDAQEKITLRNYRRQLLFYKLLVEHSHDFKDLRVTRGALEFLEPVGGAIASLELEITQDEVDRLAKLVGIVYRKILALDFPDVSAYAKDVSGIEQFEEDLLSSV